jgi:hypothetical protein
MIVPNDTQLAVLEYFSGERREMVLILCGSAILSALVFWMWITTRTGFALAFAATVLASAILFSATAVSLLQRDKGISAAIVQGIDTGQHASTIAAERERISVVLSKYRYYRYAASAIAVLALCLMLSVRQWVHGLAAGLLLLVSVQVLIDHFSERRADVYFERLTAVSAE